MWSPVLLVIPVRCHVGCQKRVVNESLKRVLQLSVSRTTTSTSTNENTDIELVSTAIFAKPIDI